MEVAAFAAEENKETHMKLLKIFAAFFIGLFWASAVEADIYVWTDENGVTNFTNNNPPPEAKIFIKDVVFPGEEPAVEIAQVQSERELILEETLIEANERLGKALETTVSLAEGFDRRLAGSNRRAEEAAETARDLESRLVEAEERADEALKRAESVLEDTGAPYPYSSISYVYPYSYRQHYKYRSGYGNKYHFKKRPHGFRHKGYSRGHHYKGHYPSRFPSKTHIAKHRISRHPHKNLHRRHSLSRSDFGKRHGGFRGRAHFGGRRSRR